MDNENVFAPCPQCGDKKGTTPTCDLCKQYNPALRHEEDRLSDGRKKWLELGKEINDTSEHKKSA